MAQHQGYTKKKQVVLIDGCFVMEPARRPVWRKLSSTPPPEFSPAKSKGSEYDHQTIAPREFHPNRVNQVAFLFMGIGKLNPRGEPRLNPRELPTPYRTPMDKLSMQGQRSGCPRSPTKSYILRVKFGNPATQSTKRKLKKPRNRLDG